MVIYREMMESGMFDKVLDMMDNPFIGNMMKGFGINPEQFTNALGYYAIRNTMVTMLAGSLFAVIKSASLISLEEYEKTSEFLMSRPLTRIEIMHAKILSFHSNLFILNLSASIIGFISLEIFKYSDYNLFSYFVLFIL